MANEWFESGFQRVKEVAEENKKNFDFGNNDASRFWVRAGEVRNIIFLDNFDWKIELGGRVSEVVPFGRYEYRVDLNNGPESWRNGIYFTCTKNNNIPCIPAEKNFKRLFVGALTVLDVTPFTDKNGEVKIIPKKKLFVAVPTALAILETKKERKGNLMGWKFAVARHGDISPKVGNDFESEEQFTVDKLRELYPDVNLDPLGFSAADAFKFYRNLFNPQSYEDQKRLFEHNPGAMDGYGTFKGKPRGKKSYSSTPSAKNPEPVVIDDDDSEVISF